jgi:aspartate/methionine/tyrosine aminotransferase
MHIDEFRLERTQSLWENRVRYNLTESGLHPYALRDLLSAEEQAQLLGLSLGYGWTNGAVELRQAIAALYAERTADNVLVTNGSAEANFILVWSLLEPGDAIIYMLPNYMQIHGIANSLGATITPLYLREELRWAPDLDQLEHLLTPRTRMISICHPNNPTGATLGPEEMQRLVTFARRHGLYLHADEIYRGAEMAGEELPSFADLYEKAIVTSGLSKAMGLPGLRIGWLLGPPDIVAAAWHRKDYTSITTTITSEFVATRVLEPARRRVVLDRGKAVLRGNLATLQQWVAGLGGLLSFIPPRAGGMAFLRYGLARNSTELCDSLREAQSVFLVPGDCYGMDRYVRIGIGVEPATLRGGLARTREFLLAAR